MTETKRRTKRPKQKIAKTNKKKVEQALAKLREFYELGREVLEADEHNPLKKEYSPGVVREIALKIGMAHDYAYKARKFAGTYSKCEFRELCSLRRPDGLPLGCRHVIALLRIPEKRRRKSLQSRAAKEGMSVRELSREISQQMGIDNDAGRKPKSPITVDEALMQVIAMSRRWNRWYNGFDSEDESEEDRIFLNGLPKEVAASMKQISSKIEKLQVITEGKRKLMQQQTKRKKRKR